MMTAFDHWRLGWAVARSLANYKLEGAPHPFSATFAVTNRCNLRCRYCNTPFLDPHHLSLTEIEAIFRRLKKIGVVRLGLAGGEPLVRNDIEAIVGLAKSLGFWVQLNSNLNLYRRHEALFDDVALVYTSLDGTPEHHQAARGDVSLNGTFEAIRSLRARKIPVIAICVVDTHNTEDADYLLEQAAALDIHMHFQPRCLETDLFRGAYAADLDNQKLRAFWRRLGERRRQGARVASTGLYLEHLAEWDDFRQLAVPATEMRCAAGTGFLYVDPLGNAYPCAYTKGKVPAVNLVHEDWRPPSHEAMPCNDCAAGPLVEFNMLFRSPVRSALHLAANHVRGTKAGQPKLTDGCAPKTPSESPTETTPRALPAS